MNLISVNKEIANGISTKSIKLNKLHKREVLSNEMKTPEPPF